AAERRGKGVEVEQHLREIAAAENSHVWTPALAGSRDDVGEAVAIDVAGGNTDAAAEIQIVGEEAGEQSAAGAGKDLDVRSAAGAGGGNDVGKAVAVDIAGRHKHAAAKTGIVRQEAAQSGRQRLEGHA